jgi:peptide deformylase
MLRPIRYYGDPVLRKVAAPVRHFGDELAALVGEMREIMYALNGRGLAAPQIGVQKRVFIALEFGDKETSEEDYRDDLSADEKRRRWGVVNEHVMVNPEIVWVEGEQVHPEGCLSLPGLWAEEVRRDLEIEVRYQDADGAHHVLKTSGELARTIQHELDHLDGILYIDRLDDETRRVFMEAHRKELAELQREAKALLKELKREAAAKS